MKIVFPLRKRRHEASALVLAVIMCTISLAILGGAMTWSANNTRLTHRSIQYNRSIAAAEATTEKVLSMLTRDFLYGGQKMVSDNMNIYRQTVATTADSTYWNGWQFNDGTGGAGRTYVQGGTASYVVLDSAYSGLKGWVSIFNVVSHAEDQSAMQDVIGGVLQEVEMARIPVFQFAMYSSGDMEISCGRPFSVTGRVHANRTLYVEPDSELHFLSDVTAVEAIIFGRDPDEGLGRGAPKGSVTYLPDWPKKVTALTLPIGTTNTPDAIRKIIEMPLAGEDPNSPLGRLRFYNLADMVITVTPAGMTASSGRFNNFAVPVPSSELARIVTATTNFFDAREGKTVWPIDINIGLLTYWSQTNNSVRVSLASNDISCVYVVDNRNLGGANLGAVRVVNGTMLPTNGLTVATARPLYVLGNYNQTNSALLGTANTTKTQPAALIADAITILSTNWSDKNSTNAVDARLARPTTVNAALLTGVVESTLGKYSGGMENFPRFLETWGTTVFTYNGSMVKMFPSFYATNAWGKGNVYAPPTRNWAYDLNFDNGNKLPPKTPSLAKVFRGRWTTVAPNQNTIAAAP